MMRAVVTRALFTLMMVAGLAAAAGSVAQAEPRVALVVGNSNYGGDLGQLPNPVNDAKLMAETLRKVGFDVVEVEDADQAALKQAIVDFGDKLSGAGTGATGLFFYAGHGVQMGGENYLIPVHAALRKPADLDVQAVPIELVLKQMDFAQSTVNIVILDACRNNPLAESARGISRGLAEIKLKPIGSFISFSTAPGQVAEDGNGANSPYTAALAQAILNPGLDLAEVFRSVRKSVLKATNQKQVPWDSWSLTDPYYFIPPHTAAPAMTAATEPLNPPDVDPTSSASRQQVAQLDPKQIELAFWNSIQNSGNPADFQAYLDQYPGGSFAALANNRLKALGASKQPEADRTVAPAGAAVVFTAVDQLVYTKNDNALYEAPDVNAAVISKTPPSTAVRASGRSPDGLWWQLHLPNGRVAYAKASDIDERADAAQPITGTPAEPAETTPNFALTPAPSATPGEAGSDQALPNFSLSHDETAAPAETTDNQTANAPNFGGPADPVAKQYFDLGEALFQQGDVKGARDAFDKAVARDPKNAQAVMRRGETALVLDDLDAALADLNYAVALDVNLIEAQGNRILARLAAGDIDGAAKASDEAQQVAPTFWSVNAIAAYYLAGRLDDAVAMAERVTRDDPTFTRGWIWQAIVMKGQGRDGEAFDSLQTAMDAIGNRDWPVAVIEWMQGKRTADRVSAAAKGSGDPKQALRQLAEADFFLGEAAYSAGDRAEAEKRLGQAVGAQKTHDLTPDLLAYACAKALLAKMARE